MRIRIRTKVGVGTSVSVRISGNVIVRVKAMTGVLV